MAAGKLVGDAAIYGGAWRAHRRRLDRGIWKDFQLMSDQAARKGKKQQACQRNV
jgi:hypothetical protein